MSSPPSAHAVDVRSGDRSFASDRQHSPRATYKPAEDQQGGSWAVRVNEIRHGSGPTPATSAPAPSADQSKDRRDGRETQMRRGHVTVGPKRRNEWNRQVGHSRREIAGPKLSERAANAAVTIGGGLQQLSVVSA
jgi:hypothetical protein